MRLALTVATELYSFCLEGMLGKEVGALIDECGPAIALFEDLSQ
jgi:hypothetical protein